jgi:hypothetical protein
MGVVTLTQFGHTKFALSARRSFISGLALFQTLSLAKYEIFNKNKPIFSQSAKKFQFHAFE